MPRHGRKKALSVMLQGTSSHVGKSVLTAALCAILRKRGFRVAPFKAQNMALNSFITPDGGEIGRAQAFQAEAAGMVPTVDINPVLLKPSSDSRSQVIIHGKVFGVMSAAEYHAFKKEARRYVRESYSRLSSLYDVIVIEGAGSPAEVNLRANDIANMGMAAIADAPVVLIGDIDRGGVFASLLGTISLLTERERKRVAGFIINKFRGDKDLLKPGLSFLKRKTGIQTLGVIPYLKDMLLPGEDSVTLDELASDRKRRAGEAGARRDDGDFRIKVLRLPRISNFTDFDPFMCDPGVSLDFVDNPSGLDGAHLVIIPGSKNTIEDLLWIKRKGFHHALHRFVESGGTVAGVCAGFQMLGKSVRDPYSVESGVKRTEGLRLMDADTVLKREKKTFQVEARLKTNAKGRYGHSVSGYEIHMGETSSKERPFSAITRRNGKEVNVIDGAISSKGNVFGTYIHGIFDNDAFRKDLIASIALRAGVKIRPAGEYRLMGEKALQTLALSVEENMDIKALLRIIGI